MTMIEVVIESGTETETEIGIEIVTGTVTENEIVRRIVTVRKMTPSKFLQQPRIHYLLLQ